MMDRTPGHRTPNRHPVIAGLARVALETVGLSAANMATCDRLGKESAMFTRWKLLLSAVVVIGLAALAVAGWLVFAPSPNPFSAEEILHQGRVNASVVATYKFTTDARFRVQVEGGPEHQEIRSEAVVVAGEGMHVKATQNGNYGETLLDGRWYDRESDAGPWEEWPDPFPGPETTNFPNPNLHFQILDSLTDVSQEGEEVLRGVRVNKITGALSQNGCLGTHFRTEHCILGQRDVFWDKTSFKQSAASRPTCSNPLPFTPQGMFLHVVHLPANPDKACVFECAHSSLVGPLLELSRCDQRGNKSGTGRSLNQPSGVDELQESLFNVIVWHPRRQLEQVRLQLV